MAKNNIETQAELDILNAKWKADKKSLTAKEKFRRNALKRTILSRGRRIGLKSDEQMCVTILKKAYDLIKKGLVEASQNERPITAEEYLRIRQAEISELHE